MSSPSSSRRTVLFTLGGALLLALLTWLSPRADEADRHWREVATTLSPGPQGTKALLLLFQQVGLSASQLRVPAYRSLPEDTVLWELGSTPVSESGRRSLLAFARNGGTVVAGPEVLSPLLEALREEEREADEEESAEPEPLKVTDLTPPLQTRWEQTLSPTRGHTLHGLTLPPDEVFAHDAKDELAVAAFSYGSGRLVLLGLHKAVRNAELATPGVAPFIVRLAHALGTRHVFDEVAVGFAEVDLATWFSQLPYRWGVAQLVLALAVLVLALARRRLPAESASPPARRRTLDHLDAVARLWAKGKDPGLALEALLTRAEERARARLGGAPEPLAFLRWVERARPSLLDRAKQAWETAEALTGGPSRPSLTEARRVALALAQVEKESLRW